MPPPAWTPAVARCLEERRVVTADLGGNASTAQMGDEAARLVSARGRRRKEQPHQPKGSQSCCWIFHPHISFPNGGAQFTKA